MYVETLCTDQARRMREGNVFTGFTGVCELYLWGGGGEVRYVLFRSCLGERGRLYPVQVLSGVGGGYIARSRLA